MVILLRYGEIALKSEFVRNTMERALIRNIESKLMESRIQAKVERDRGHIYITSNEEKKIGEILARTFGVVSFSYCRKCANKFEEIERNVLEVVWEKIGGRRRFAIRARRAGEFKFTSMELARELGSSILSKFPDLKVDLENPELEIFVEVRESGCYIYTEKINGPGGLPYGTQGKIVALLETEDDVIATWLIMKRGCRVLCIGECERLLEALARWNRVKFEKAKPSLENGIKIARKNAALGIVSGMAPEKLLEYSPQPLDYPIFLPLSGLDEKMLCKLREVIL